MSRSLSDQRCPESDVNLNLGSYGSRSGRSKKKNMQESSQFKETTTLRFHVYFVNKRTSALARNPATTPSTLFERHSNRIANTSRTKKGLTSSHPTLKHLTSIRSLEMFDKYGSSGWSTLRQQILACFSPPSFSYSFSHLCSSALLLPSEMREWGGLYHHLSPLKPIRMLQKTDTVA